MSAKKTNKSKGFAIDAPAPEATQVTVRTVRQAEAAAPRPIRSNRAQSVEVRSGVLSTVARHAFNVGVAALNVLGVIGLLASAYSSRIAPTEWPFAVVAAMTFPAWLLGVVVLFVLDLIFWRRTAWVAGLGMLACVGQIHEYSPLNLPRWGMSEEQKAHSFTLMTYNVCNFDNFLKRDVSSNRQLAYVLEQNPDIVCFQEARFLSPTDANRITQQQLDSVHIQYPYVMTQGENFAILSRFPVQPINLDFPKEEFRSGDMAAWRLNIQGKVVNLFSVHLRSLALTVEDKAAYQDIVNLDSLSRGDLRDARAAIVPKLESAGIEREGQIRYLQKYLARYGGKNALICGDFNDPVNCYGLYLLERESHMRQAYEYAGFGPMITYNANDLYFRIDHVLYRGALKPYSIRRGHLKDSDHYPITTTFLIE